MKEINYNAESEMHGDYPKIKKLGACSPYGEMTPFVWRGRLMRLELCDPERGVNTSDSHFGSVHALIRDVETGEVVSRTAYGSYYQ